MLSNAFSILKNAADKLDQQPADETNSFCTFIATKMRKYSPQTQTRLQHAILELLMKADQGLLDWSTSYSHSASSYCLSQTMPPPSIITPVYSYEAAFTAPPSSMPTVTVPPVMSTGMPKPATSASTLSPGSSLSSESFTDLV